MKVGLFITCLVDLMRPEIGMAAVRLLESAGCTVEVPLKQTCCGQPTANAGFERKSEGAMRHFVDTFAAYDYIVAPSGSCVAHVREHYGRLAQTDAVQHVRARTLELCEFLTDVLAVTTLDARSPVAEPRGPDDALIIPVRGVRANQLRDTFEDARGSGRRHDAIDIMAPHGTPVVAAAPGTVEKLFFSDGGGGITAYIRSPDRNWSYYYAHLQEYARGLREGQRVRRGQRIGAVGSSGNASADAPHLHFAILQTTSDAEWWEPASAVNPYPLLTR